MFHGYFHLFNLLLVEGELISIEDPSLSVHGYQLLPITTSQLVGKNREFDVSCIFLGFFTYCWWRGAFSY